MEILSKTLQLIFSLSILVVYMSWENFMQNRIFKTRVEKFYCFLTRGFL